MSDILSYHWEPRPCAPRNFHIRTSWFYVKYGDDHAVGVIEDSFSSGITVDECVELEPVLNQTPRGVDITWFSYMERKCYDLESDFTHEQIEEIENHLQSGFWGINDDEDRYRYEGEMVLKKRTYNRFYVCCIPGGEVHFYLGCFPHRVIKLNFAYLAEETPVSEDDVCYGVGNMVKNDVKYWDSVEDFYDKAQCEGKYYLELEDIKTKFGKDVYERVKIHRKLGVPDSLWKDYFKRYSYTISIELEDHGCMVTYDRWKFSNAEFFARHWECNRHNIIANPSVPREAMLVWNTPRYIYQCCIYFNEEEVISIFKNAYSSTSEDNGVLSIFVSKYNNLVTLTLDVGGKQYILEKSQIDIFKNVLNPTSSDDWESVFENYEGPDHQVFIGV